MDREALGVFKSYKQLAERLVSNNFRGDEKRDMVFLLTSTLMARDQLKDRAGIEDFFEYALAHQDELLSLAKEIDSAIASFNETAGSAIDRSLVNTVSVREEQKLGEFGTIPLLLGERQVRPKDVLRRISATKRAFADQNSYMRNSELAQNDAELYKAIHDEGNWSELHLNAKTPKHFLATFIIDLYPAMLRRTGMYGPELDTDELVRALCENMDSKSELSRLIDEQGWFDDDGFSPEFRTKRATRLSSN